MDIFIDHFPFYETFTRNKHTSTVPRSKASQWPSWLVFIGNSRPPAGKCPRRVQNPRHGQETCSTILVIYRPDCSQMYERLVHIATTLRRAFFDFGFSAPESSASKIDSFTISGNVSVRLSFVAPTFSRKRWQCWQGGYKDIDDHGLHVPTTQETDSRAQGWKIKSIESVKSI